MTPLQEQVTQWLAWGARGASSETMANWLGFGKHRDWPSHPYDPADFNRCLQLLEMAPLLRAELPRMRDVSPSWAALVDNWAALEASFVEEAGLGWTKARGAPKTYKLMADILDKIRDPNVVKVSERLSIRFPSTASEKP